MLHSLQLPGGAALSAARNWASLSCASVQAAGAPAAPFAGCKCATCEATNEGRSVCGLLPNSPRGASGRAPAPALAQLRTSAADRLCT